MNNFWSRVFEARGLLFRGRDKEELLMRGYTIQEIKAAATCNQRYYLNKARAGGLNFVLSG